MNLAFRQACSRYATGITVTTVRAPDGSPHGMTANSFTSVSLNPPLVLVCVEQSANILPYFLGNENFAINVLRESQRELSIKFAGRGHDRFGSVPWSAGVTGAPLLEHALAHFECRRLQAIPAGDHTILLGEVLSAFCGEGSPLVYYRSGYHVLDTSD